MSSDALAILLFCSFLGAVALVSILRLVGKQRSRELILNALASALGGVRNRTSFWSLSFPRYLVSGDLQGFRYECEYFEEMKNSPERFQIRLFSTFPESMEIRHKSSAGAVSLIDRAIGFEPVAGTGDPDFDGEFHLKCRSKAFAGSFLAGSEKRHLIQKIILYDPPRQVHLRYFSYGPNQLSCHPESLQVTMTGRIQERATPEKVKTLISMMIELAGHEVAV